MPETCPDEILPLVEERITVAKREVESGRVRIRTVVDERQEWVRETLLRDEASIERVKIDEEFEAPPEPRWEGDTLVVPVVEEILVIHKHYRVKEELRVAMQRRQEVFEQPVTVRSQRAVIERSEPDETTPSSPN